MSDDVRPGVACDGAGGWRLDRPIGNRSQETHMLDKRTIDRIKATITVADVLARHGAAALRRGIKGHVGACPICGTSKNKRSRAFTVSPDGRAWYCFSDCRRGGSVIDLVMALEACEARTAIKMIQRWIG
jgi:DNA primase